MKLPETEEEGREYYHDGEEEYYREEEEYYCDEEEEYYRDEEEQFNEKKENEFKQAESKIRSGYKQDIPIINQVSELWMML